MTDRPLPRHWRAFSVRARAEKRVAERLSASGVEVLIPLRIALHKWSDRKKRVEVPLFPGYVFARVDEHERLAALTDGAVVKTVSFGGTPAVVPDREIETIRALAALPDRVEAVTREAFPVGAEVLLTNGPLQGARGYVTGHPREAYLVVEVPSVRQSLRVQVPADWTLRPASTEPPEATNRSRKRFRF